MMSKPKAPFIVPFYNSKKEPLHYKPKYELSVDNFGNLYLANHARYSDLECILGSHIYYEYIAIIFNKLKMMKLELEPKPKPKHDYIFYGNKLKTKLLNLNNLKNLKKLQKNLAVQPNHEKIFLSSFEYNLLNKHVEHLDQQMGAGHYLLGNKDVKIIKNCTIILIGCITLALPAWATIQQ